MNYPKFVIFRNPDGQFYFRMFNDRNKQLLTGLPCEQRMQCITAIRQMYASVQNDHHFRMQTAHGQFYYQVTSLQHKVIAKSIMYRTMPGMAFGIDAVKKNVCVAVIGDCRTVPV